jgi:hypothetical protein
MTLTRRWKSSLLIAIGVGLAIVLALPVYQRWTVARQLEPERFNALVPTEAATTLRAALRHGMLSFSSTADIETWVRQRPRAQDFTIGAQYQNLRFFRSLEPEAQAWVLLASRLVVPTLRDGGVTMHSASRIRGLDVDHPPAAAVITRNLRAQSAFANPLGDFAVLAELNPGDPELVADARRAMTVPTREIGVRLLQTAVFARDETARNALVQAGTDIMLATPRGPHEARLFTSYGTREEPVVAAIIQYRLRLAQDEQCLDLEDRGLPRAPLKDVWISRVAAGSDALCLWLGLSFGKELLIAHPDIVLRLLTRHERVGDGWRRHWLIDELTREVVAPFARGQAQQMTPNQQRFCAKHGPTACPWLIHAGVTRAVQAAVWGPKVNVLVKAGQVVPQFADQGFQKAWQSRLAVSEISLGRATGTAANDALTAALGIDRAALESAFAREQPHFDCRSLAGNHRMWGKPTDPARLVRVQCTPTPRANSGQGRPLEASDAEAASWFKQRAIPFLLADGRGTRIVWLPRERELPADELVGVSDLDGDGWLEMVWAYCTDSADRGWCTAELALEFWELTPDDMFASPLFAVN